MGNQKLKWTGEEEEALLNGIAKHGPGKWKNILNDPEFAPFLTHRSNIDLKDKWRNLSVSNSGQGSKDKSRADKLKALTVTHTVTPVQNSKPTNGNVNAPLDDIASDGKNAPRYDAMLFEALSSIKDINGCDINAMVHFIEQRHEVPQTFRRVLSSRLRRLVSQGKLEKVENCYRLANNTIFGGKTPPKQKDIRPRQLQNSELTYGESVQEAAITAAYQVAEAENKSFLAAEAVKEAERISRMAEDSNAMLRLVNEIYEQCSRGEIVLFA